jgi:acetyl-CoA carboxylase biotin carboxylase subunit
MNTRIQVEHPVTEMVTGVDLVQWQIRIARGERLTLAPEQMVRPIGHAIECRVYAEDPDAGFMPSPGRITSLRVPSGPGIRDDGWAESGTDVPIFYDPLISKLIAWGENRPHAIARLRRALMEYEIRGIRTSLPFFHWMLRQPAFVEADFHTEFLDELLQRRGDEGFADVDPSLEEVAAIAACVAEAENGRSGRTDQPSLFELGRSAVALAEAERTGPTRAEGNRGPVLVDRPNSARTWKGRARLEGLRG